MSKKANPTAIGGFVLGAMVLIVGSILVFSSGALLQKKIPFVTYFPGTVQGLEIGARVEFQGVQVGQVTSVKLDYWPTESRFSVPVSYELWPDSLRTQGVEDLSDGPEMQGQRTKRLVEKFGLRAKLESVSLVTGQYMVSLDLHPDTDVKYVGTDKNVTEIPAIESTRDKLSSMLQGLDLKGLASKVNTILDDVQELVDDPKLKALAGNADKLLNDIDVAVSPTVKQLNKTLADYSTLAATAGEQVKTVANRIDGAAGAVTTLSNNVNKQVDPVSKSATSALNEARKAFATIEAMVATDSATRVNLDSLLEEGAGAARSLRVLADYLEQNPDALIKGKY
jgi:paraquat-inducible protein B